MTAKVELIQAESLVVGPDEVLIISVPEMSLLVDASGAYPFVDELMHELEEIGLADRALVIAGDIKMAKVKR